MNTTLRSLNLLRFKHTTNTCVKFNLIQQISLFFSHVKEAALAARLKRKAELQKKNSQKMDFSASLKAEKEKQNDLKKTKEERRNALCEELGRGC